MKRIENAELPKEKREKAIEEFSKLTYLVLGTKLEDIEKE